MQMHYAPLQIAATIVFIPDDKRLSGDNTIVNPIFSAAKRGLTDARSRTYVTDSVTLGEQANTRQVKIVKLC